MSAALDLAARVAYMERTFAGAFAALEDLAKSSPADADRIAAAAIATIRSSRPHAMRADVDSRPFERIELAKTDPVSQVSRELADGTHYDITREGAVMRLYVRDATGHDVAAHPNALEVTRLRADLAAVASTIPGSGG